ncbi:unnamed protein product, partial [Medioppia subpectinata]
PAHSVQTCFTGDNLPAVCVDQSLCPPSAADDLSDRQVYTSSNCTDERQVCCPMRDVNGHGGLDAFIVPRWDWQEWLQNWTYRPPTPIPHPNVPPYPPASGSVVLPPYPGQGEVPPPSVVQANISVISQPATSSTPASVPSAPGAPVGGVTSCGARTNIVQKDIEMQENLGFIVGGQVAQANTWPWVVAVYSSGRFICGASLIDKDHVLCAAHCVSHGGRITRAEQIQVQIGAHDRRGSGQYYKVDKIVVHSGYNERIMQNDISMFKLGSPVSFGKTAAPVCLPPNTASCPDSTKMNAYLAGWGTTSAGGSTSNELREVTVPTIPLKDCQRAYDSNMVTTKQICAGFLGQGGKDTCQGDSGGPMVVKMDAKVNQYYQCGIVSWGRGCAEARYPGVYTKVSEYLDWIRANKV